MLFCVILTKNAVNVVHSTVHGSRDPHRPITADYTGHVQGRSQGGQGP